MLADIDVNLAGIQKASRALAAGLNRYDLHETRDAVKAGAELIQATWMQYVSGATVSYSKGDFTINSVSGQYRSAVMGGLKYPMDGDVLSGGVIVNLDYAEKLEKGFDPYDIKPGMLRSPKAKQGKPDDQGNSEPYIDVPFRHAEQSIPRAIKTEVQHAGRSLGVIRLGKGLGAAPFGLRTKLSPMRLHWSEGQLQFGAPYTWKTGLLSGLTRQPVQGGGGVYMTFRRISGKSSGSSWIHPGVEPKPVTAAIKENLGPALEAMVQDAFVLDVVNFSRRMGLEGVE
jgi:hypothetical protein